MLNKSKYEEEDVIYEDTKGKNPTISSRNNSFLSSSNSQFKMEEIVDYSLMMDKYILRNSIVV